MRWLLIILLMLASGTMGPAFAGNADELLLRAQAAIYPKIILLDKDLGDKTVSNTVLIRVIHAASDKSEAQEMRRLIEVEYSNNLGGNTIRVETVSFDEFEGQEPATAYILMRGSSAAHQKVTRYASGNRRVVFSYDYKDMKNNALVSLLMKEKTYIYLNKAAMPQYDIRFLPLFYKIVKVIE